MSLESAARTKSGRDMAAPRRSVLSAFPVWMRFSLFMAAIILISVAIFSVYNPNAIGFLFPGLFVCVAVALSNLAAQKLGVTATKR